MGIPVFKFIVPKIEYIGPYFEKLDVMFPSVIIAIVLGWIVSVYVPDKA